LVHVFDLAHVGVGIPIIKAFKGLKVMIKIDCVHLVGMLVIGFFW
jgi:hypothetical protein